MSNHTKIIFKRFERGTEVIEIATDEGAKALGSWPDSIKDQVCDSCGTIAFLLLLGVVDLLEGTIELESKDFPGPASLPERHATHLQRERKVTNICKCPA